MDSPTSTTSNTITKRFNRIYDDTWDRVNIYLTARARSIHDLHDLVQETYLELYRALERGVTPESTEAFVIHIAKQKLARYYSDMSETPFSLENNDSDYIDPVDQIALDRWVNTKTEDRTVDKLLIEQITHALPASPWPIRQIFYLRFHYGMTLPEIASELNLSVNQTRNHYYRTLQDLRDEYPDLVQGF